MFISFGFKNSPPNPLSWLYPRGFQEWISVLKRGGTGRSSAKASPLFRDIHVFLSYYFVWFKRGDGRGEFSPQNHTTIPIILHILSHSGHSDSKRRRGEVEKCISEWVEPLRDCSFPSILKTHPLALWNTWSVMQGIIPQGKPPSLGYTKEDFKNEYLFWREGNPSMCPGHYWHRRKKTTA